MPGVSGVRFWNPFSRSDCGVSLKMKYSYSEPNCGQEAHVPRALRPTFWSSCRGRGLEGRAVRVHEVQQEGRGVRLPRDDAPGGESTRACASG